MKIVFLILLGLSLQLYGMAKESIALVREDVPRGKGETERVEIEVFQEVDGYMVECRTSAAHKTPPPALPTVAIETGRVLCSTCTIPGKQISEGCIFFPITERDKMTDLQIFLTYSLPDAEGNILKKKRLPLGLCALAYRSHTTATRRVHDESGELHISPVALPKPMDEDCVLRLRPNIPLAVGSAPLLIELYRTKYKSFILFTEDTSPAKNAAFRITSVIAESHLGHAVDMLKPSTEKIATKLATIAPQTSRAISVDKRGLGQFVIASGETPCFGSSPEGPIRITLSLEDEDGRSWSDILLDIEAFPADSPQTNN